MSDPEHRLILLTGAPLSSSLDWSEDSLETSLIPSFAMHELLFRAVQPTPESVAPSWRSIPLQSHHLPTGLTQASHPEWTMPRQGSQDDVSFFTAMELSVQSPSEDESDSVKSDSHQGSESAISQYYEHSFAVHELPSSQIVPWASASTTAASDSNEYSFGSNTESEMDDYAHAIHSRLASAPLNDLQEIPKANYLHSITPQTMTINLVIGIISISNPRVITTRRGQRTVELVEMTVGDDTRAGFGINIWLPLPHYLDAKKTTVQDDLREHTLSLRPQDIVLARNIALGSFKGNVYGQSLRRGITTLDLLYRNVVDAKDRRGALRARELDEASTNDTSLSKVKRVRDWVLQFVGKKTKTKTAGVSRREVVSSLPLDTQ